MYLISNCGSFDLLENIKHQNDDTNSPPISRARHIEWQCHVGGYSVWTSRGSKHLKVHMPNMVLTVTLAK